MLEEPSPVRALSAVALGWLGAPRAPDHRMTNSKCVLSSDVLRPPGRAARAPAGAGGGGVNPPGIPG